MKVKNELQAGLFLIVSLVVLVFGVYLLGQDKHIFASTTRYHTKFQNVRGLSEGAPVRLGGITVGRVEKISFSNNAKSADITVSILVNSEHKPRIREDSKISLATQGLLGDQYVSISTGMGATELPPDSLIESNEPGDIADVLDKAGVVVDNTVEISDNINDVLKKFKGKTMDDIGGISKRLSNLLKEVEEGDGFLHNLVYSSDEGDSLMGSLQNAAKSLAAITDEVKSGEGLLHGLIYDKSGDETIAAFTKAAKSLATTAEHISEISAQIESGEGLLHDLVYGNSPEGVAEIVAKLNRSASNFEDASRALKNGEGTLGALLIDSSVYDNIVEVTDNAKRSFILKQAIRSSLKD